MGINNKIKSTNPTKEIEILTDKQIDALEVIKEGILLNEEILIISGTQMCKGGLSITIKTNSEKEINFYLTKAGVCHSPHCIKRIPKEVKE